MEGNKDILKRIIVMQTQMRREQYELDIAIKMNDYKEVGNITNIIKCQSEELNELAKGIISHA